MATTKKTSAKKPVKRVLGRGLDALIPKDSEESAEKKAVAPEQAGPGSIAAIPVSQIETNPYQPRTHFDEEALDELAQSIKTQGIIQPITVRRLAKDSYQLISGERRFQASQRAGLTEIPAYIRTANDEQMLQMALIENIQRENLNPIEVALGYQRLLDECDLTLEKAGEQVGKNRATVNNYLRLLKLPPEIQAGLRDKRLGMGHARALISIADPLKQLELYNQVISNDLSVRATEDLVRSLNKKDDKKESPTEKTERTAYALQAMEVERSLGKKLDSRVKISTGKDGSGEIKIPFYNSEDLNRILEIIHEG